MTRFNYEEAFCRNLGLITPQEQQRLRSARVAVIGMGVYPGPVVEVMHASVDNLLAHISISKL